MKKSPVIGISLVLVVAASVFWWFWPDRSVEADRPVEFESELSPAEGMLLAEQGAEFRGARDKLSDGERPPKRESVKKGAQRRFSLWRGKIGYVDVPSLVNDLDTYSVVAVLQEHAELTGADESLEIVTHGVYENELWGYEAQFAQVIEGVETGWVGNILFSADGQVSAISGKLVNAWALSVNSVVVLAPEAETIALEAADYYAETIPDRPEWSDIPVRLEVLPSAMLYELDENDALHRVWRVPVSISGPKFDNVEVVVSAESGRIVRMESVVKEQASACSEYPCDEVTIRVCDANGGMIYSCDDASSTTVRPANQSAQQIAADALNAIRSKSTAHINRKPGQDCKLI